MTEVELDKIFTPYDMGHTRVIQLQFEIFKFLFLFYVANCSTSLFCLQQLPPTVECCSSASSPWPVWAHWPSGRFSIWNASSRQGSWLNECDCSFLKRLEIWTISMVTTVCLCISDGTLFDIIVNLFIYYSVLLWESMVASFLNKARFGLRVLNHLMEF